VKPLLWNTLKKKEQKRGKGATKKRKINPPTTTKGPISNHNHKKRTKCVREKEQKKGERESALTFIHSYHRSRNPFGHI